MGFKVSQFTIVELQSIRSACDMAYRKKDLELRRVRRNKAVIDEVFKSQEAMGLDDGAGILSFDEQVEEAKQGKREFLQLKNKITHLLRCAK